MTMPRRRARKLLLALVRMAPDQRMKALAAMPPPAIRAIAEEWWWQAHRGQGEPRGNWRIWLLRAGRGFGKTRAGAEWVSARARETPGAQIALAGGNLGEVVRVMVKGPSGLIATARTGEMPLWLSSERTLRFPNRAEAFAYSAELRKALRGPSTISPGATNSLNGPMPTRRGTISCSASGAGRCRARW